MKVMIVYSSAGTGHRRAAEAIYEYLDESLKKDSCLVDILKFTPHLFKILYSDGYTFLIKNIPWVWSFLYWLTDKEIFAPVFNLARKSVNFLFLRRFAKFALQEKPQVVISTHFMPNEIISGLKSKNKLDCFLASIITDYTAHSFWISKGVDKYIVSLDTIRDILVKKAVNRENVLTLGIPVDRKFFNLKTRAEAAEIVGIDAQKFSALLVTGVIGLNNLGKVANIIKDEMQVMVICGSNDNLKRNLESSGSANIFTFGLVGNMEDFLGACDVMVTKAGGLTISECLITQTPMFFICKVSGQEAENIKALTSLGCAVYEPDLEKLAKMILAFKRDPERIQKMKSNIRRVAKLDVNDNIIGLIKANVR